MLPSLQGKGSMKGVPSLMKPQALEDQGWQEPCSHPLTMHWEAGLPTPTQDPFLPTPLQLLARAALTEPDSLGHVPGPSGVCCPGLPYLQLLQDVKAAVLCVLLVHHECRDFILCKHKCMEGVLAECPPVVPNRGLGTILPPWEQGHPT